MRTNSLFLSALSSLLLCSCGDDGGAADAAIDAPPGMGTFSLAWSVSDGTNPLTCDGVGAISVSVTLLKVGAGAGTVDAFGCEGGQATSRQFSPGSYDVTIDLRASGSRSLIATPTFIAGVEISASGDTPLPAQTFVVNPVGAFSFSVDGLATAGNCLANDSDGAGIQSLEFELKDAANVCVAATFVVAAGATGAATSYTSDCTTPPTPLACIEKDQVVTVSPIGSGPATLTITGQKAAIPGGETINCYDRVSSFIIPGAMLLRDLGPLSLALDYSLACDPAFIMIDAGL